MHLNEIITYRVESIPGEVYVYFRLEAHPPRNISVYVLRGETANTVDTLLVTQFW